MGSFNSSAVCVLDDDPSVLKAICRLLLSAGWESKAFAQPIEFLRYAETNQVPVAVIDMVMPLMNGLQVQSQLRRLSPATRVIMLTSADDPVIRVTAMNAGAFGFFSKPVRPDEFLVSVASAYSKL